MEKSVDVSLITVSIDVYLIYLLYYQKLNIYEKTIIILALLIHVLYLFAIFTGNLYVTDVLHISFMIYISILSLFVRNSSFILLFILIITTMLLYWYIDGKCPMGNYQTIPFMNSLTNSDIYTYLIDYITIFLLIVLLSKFAFSHFSHKISRKV